MAARNAATFLVLAGLAMAGCRGATPEPVARAGQDKPEAPPAPAQPAPPDQPGATVADTAEAPPATQSQPPRDATPVVVDPGGEDGGNLSLVEAAKAERERRAHAGQPVAVINDKTLPKYAAKGQITVAAPKERKDAAPPMAPGTEPLRDEAYWRGRALEIRQRWRQAADDVEELEQKSTELRQKFYLEGDTFTRDNQIKPEWDRVLDKLQQARVEVEAARKELAELLEEGRAAGVMPGWLREGEEEEPEGEPRDAATPPPAQSIEPPVLEPPPAGEGRR